MPASPKPPPPPEALYCSNSLRQIELACQSLPLMQRAGEAAAELAVSLLGPEREPVLVLAGPGNNGGDAFETAARLLVDQCEVHLVFTGDALRLSVDAAAARQRFLGAGGFELAHIPDVARWSLIIDGLFGIGLQREITGWAAELIGQANRLARQHGCPLLALDCPSGLDADRGSVRGAAIEASHTLTFITSKPGLLTGDGPDFCGTLAVANLGLDAETLAPPDSLRISPSLFGEQLSPRRHNSHKGSYGNAGILGGAGSMVGAAFLAGRAALKLGSGRVYLGLLDPQAPALDPLQPEVMLRDARTLLSTPLTALACGPGMGSSEEAATLLQEAALLDLPLVLDADALNLVAASSTLRAAFTTRSAATLLTPHPAEAARLLACDIASVQNDRIAAACELAHRHAAHVVLKGCGSIVAAPDGRCFLNTSGNAGLATAGSGDVLTGFVTALLAQGWPPLAALLAAVHLHGCAADALVAEGQGPVGLSAGELIKAGRGVLNNWIYHAS